jgi:hypothetical protein
VIPRAKFVVKRFAEIHELAATHLASHSIRESPGTVVPGGFCMLTFASPARLVSIDTLAGYFSSGASLAVKSLRYLRLSETILEEQLGPERIARVFRLSACKTARIDCAFVILCGSFSKYRANREIWSPEPEATIALGLVGGDFALVNDQATKFVAKHWREIQALAVAPMAA